jgi:transcriptional regulator NrdR family protein
MDCHICGYKTRVVNSRHQSRLNQVWRRRLCVNCKCIFTSVEKNDLERSLSVKSRAGSIDPFVREKLLISINASLGHRKNHINEAVAITDTVISKLQRKYKNSLIDIDSIIDSVKEVLVNFDKTAVIYYDAYYSI